MKDSSILCNSSLKIHFYDFSLELIDKSLKKYYFEEINFKEILLKQKLKNLFSWNKREIKTINTFNYYSAQSNTEVIWR